MSIIECAKPETVQMIYTSGTDHLLKMATATPKGPDYVTIALMFSALLILLTILFMIIPKKLFIRKKSKVKHTNLLKRPTVTFY